MLDSAAPPAALPSPPPAAAERVRSAGSERALLVLLGFILALALGLRLRDLSLASGTLDIDEARLTLVARGVLEHGWPVLPSGKVYTRGILQSGLMAASLAVVGPLDLAARLPSVLAGLLLVVVLYLYGRSLAGPLAGLAAAFLAATSVPLVAWSREAWLYALFLLLWMAALYLFDRAVAEGSARALVLGGVAVGLGMLAHELTAFLLPTVAAWLVLWLRRGHARARRLRSALLAAIPIVAGVGLQALFSQRLRADTVGGSLGEVRKFLVPAEDFGGVQFYVVGPLLAERRWLVVLAALVGLLLAGRSLRARLLLLLGSVLPLLVAIAWAAERTERYGLALIPPLFVLAGVGLSVVPLRGAFRVPLRGAFGVAEIIFRSSARRPVAGLLASLGLAGLVLAAQVDPTALARVTRTKSESGAWLSELYRQGYQPDDLLVTDLPTVTYLYVGRTDGWLRSVGYEKYATAGADGSLRDIHTGAPILRTVDEFERLVRAPNRGRRLWVVGSNFRSQWFDWVERGLRDELQNNAVLRAQSEDGKRIAMLRL